MSPIAAARERKPWKNDERWRSRSLATWDSEWAEYKRLADLAGKSVNGWIRDACNEVAKLERIEERERKLAAGSPSENFAESQTESSPLVEGPGLA